MRRRLNILTLICCSLLCTIVGINEVWADNSDYTEGTSAAIRGCSGLYCYTGAVGFRATLVNKNTGKRCKYDSATNTICGSNGKNTTSKDYWFNTKDLSFTESNPSYLRECYSYSEKRTKYEFVSSNSKDSNISTSCSSTGKNFTDLGFPEVGSEKYTGDWTSSDSKIEVSRAPQNMTLVERYLSCTLGGVDEAGNKLNCTSKNGNTIDKNNKIINNIFKELTGNERIDVANIKGLENTSIQFEQLLQIGNYSLTNEDVNSALVTKGTVAEASYLYMKKGHNIRSWSANFGCVTYNNTGFKNKNTMKQDCGSSMIGGGYFTGYYGSTTYSDTLTSIPGENSAVRNIKYKDYIVTKYNGGQQYTLYNINLEQFIQLDTANVFKFWINPKIGPQCDADFQTLLANSGQYFNAESGVNRTSLISYINNNKTKYQGLINECATVENGNVTGFKTSCPLLQNLDKLSVALGSGVDTENYGCKSEIECNEPLINSITDKFGLVIERIRKKIFVEGIEDYVDPNVPYKVLITLLKGLFPSKADRLNDSVWASLGDNGPSCQGIRDCPGASAELSCSDTKKTISSNKDPECIKQGILYTLKSENDATDLKSSLNTSYTDECENCKVYCDESVSFDLSGQNELNSKITKAGTLLKWGKGEESQIFGTMTVKQTCYVVPNSKEYKIGVNAGLKSKTIHSHIGSPLAIDSKRASGRYVNTKITIDYTNPASYLKESNNDLDQKVTLVAIPTTRGVLSIKHQNSKTYVDADKDSPILLTVPSTTSLNYATTYSDNDHKKVEQFDVIANYVFAYGTYTGCTEYESNGNCKNTGSVNGGANGKSELAWYASKDDNGNYKNSEDYENVTAKEKSSYIFIGYGLPTPFTSVTCIYDKENMSSENSNKDKEPITVTVQNVGTSRSTTSADDSNDYQFTKLLGAEKKLSYSCPYKVNNQMFGYENGDSIDCDYTSPKGLDVVFRTIDLMDSETDEDLNRAFPGMSGAGVGEGKKRKMGANWNKIYTEENGAQKVFNILSSAIYNEQPMYEITLDVPLIQEIRQANSIMRSNKKDPYTNMEVETPGSLADEENGYAGYQFYKDENNNQSYAYSAFLYYLVNTCQASSGESCLKVSDTNPCIKGAGVHVPGCNQEWWNKE